MRAQRVRAAASVIFVLSMVLGCSKPAPDQAADTLYLAVLSRPATESERGVATAYLTGSAPGVTDPERCRDLLWTLVLSPEFQYIR